MHKLYEVFEVDLSEFCRNKDSVSSWILLTMYRPTQTFKYCYASLVSSNLHFTMTRNLRNISFMYIKLIIMKKRRKHKSPIHWFLQYLMYMSIEMRQSDACIEIVLIRRTQHTFINDKSKLHHTVIQSFGYDLKVEYDIVIIANFLSKLEWQDTYQLYTFIPFKFDYLSG